jgi:hypothetical protein
MNWVSVDERLPEKMGRFLVSYASGEQSIVIYHISRKEFFHYEGNPVKFWAEGIPEVPKTSKLGKVVSQMFDGMEHQWIEFRNGVDEGVIQANLHETSQILLGEKYNLIGLSTEQVEAVVEVLQTWLKIGKLV